MRHGLLRALFLAGSAKARAAAVRAALTCGTVMWIGLGLQLSALAQTEKPWLGVEIEKTPDRSGARITDILPESPLVAGAVSGTGVRRGDTITAVAGNTVQTPAEVVEQVQKLQVGQKVTLGLRSEHGAERELTVLLGRKLSSDELQAKLVGKPAPDFGAQGLLGAPLPTAAAGLLAGMRGKPVLLDFFATWCGPCLQSVPHLSELSRRHPRLRVVGVSDEEPGLIRGVMQPLGPGYTIARDPDHQGHRAYRIHSFPTLVLIDSGGVVRAVSRGNLNEIDQAVAQLLQNEPGAKAGQTAKLARPARP